MPISKINSKNTSAKARQTNEEPFEELHEKTNLLTIFTWAQAIIPILDLSFLCRMVDSGSLIDKILSGITCSTQNVI